MWSSRCVALTLMAACAGPLGGGGPGEGRAPGPLWAPVRSLWDPACELRSMIGLEPPPPGPGALRVERSAVLSSLAALACSRSLAPPVVPALAEVARIRVLGSGVTSRARTEVRQPGRIERVLAFLAARADGWRSVPHTRLAPQETLVLYSAAGEVLGVFWLGASWIGTTAPAAGAPVRGLRRLSPHELQQLRILLAPAP